MLLFVMKFNLESAGSRSRIASFPRGFQPILRLLRDLIVRIGRILPPYLFNEDGMGTNHSTEFTNNQVFASAYEYARSNMPFDYSIRWRVHQAIWLGQTAAKRFPGQSFVELGTGRGFIMQSILFSVEETVGIERMPKAYLFDTYKPYKTDGLEKQDEALGVDIYYSSTMAETANSFKRWGPYVHLVEGELPGTIMLASTLQISFLHVDLNAPQVEAECLELLWENISPGGMILLDDYANAGFAATISPVKDFFESKKQYVFTTPSGQGIVIKS
jgi:hypothetical protein